MKIIANIWFERLHREVYDNFYVQKQVRNLEKWEKKECLYNKLLPYFKGWRLSLKINLWFIKKYERYEPKKLDLMDYEFDQLSLWNKFIYSFRYEGSEAVKTLKRVL